MTLNWKEGQAPAAVEAVFEKASASVAAEVAAAFKKGDVAEADEIVRHAYLSHVSELVEAHLRFLAPSIAEAYRAKILATPRLVVESKASAPKASAPTREVTRVTKHDPQGRILEFERHQVEA